MKTSQVYLFIIPIKIPLYINTFMVMKKSRTETLSTKVSKSTKSKIKSKAKKLKTTRSSLVADILEKNL